MRRFVDASVVLSLVVDLLAVALFGHPWVALSIAALFGYTVLRLRGEA